MKLKKNWFYFLTVLFAVMGCYIFLLIAFFPLQKISETDILCREEFFLVLLGIWLFLSLSCCSRAEI